MAQKKESRPTKKKRVTVGVKYIGSADTKVISNLNWNSDNNHTMSVKDLTDNQLEYLRSQPDFRVVYE